MNLGRTIKTFRFRLAAWNALVVILTAAATLLILRQGVHWAILHEMDQILAEDLNEIAIAIEDESHGDFESVTEGLRRKAVGHQQHGWFVQLLDEQEQVVWQSDDVPPLPSVGEVVWPMFHTAGEYRFVQREIPVGGRGVAMIRAGASLRLLHSDMARIDRMVLMAAALVLIVAPAIGYLLASRAIRPVGEIIRATARMRPSRLNERLTIRGASDELDQLALTINNFLDRIATYLRRRRDFLANAAHELRTPLAAIRSSVEVTLNGERTVEEYQDLLYEIIDQCASLEVLVNQLLLISESEVEHIQREFSEVRFDEVVQQSIDMFGGVAESRDVTLEFHCPAPVHVVGIRHLLRQLANNLLDNAIKYTPSGGAVRVDLAVDEASGGARLVVEDTGVGIPPEDTPRVFERFFRGDRSRARVAETNGAGLGLSICKAVVDAHEGRITCESEPGKGSRFTVWLPSRAAVAPVAEAAGAGDQKST